MTSSHTSPLALTVITPSLNQARFIRRTIESVLAQDVPRLEYLVFDGGSTDGTAGILAEYQSRVRIVIERDEGQSDAVNKGFGVATGDVIGWLNSDDVYYPGAARTALETFDTVPEADLLYGEADHIDADDRVIEPYHTEPFDFARLQDVCFICQPAAFFRRRAVTRFGPLRKDLRYCMDYEYWLRLSAARPPVFVRRKLAGSRLHAETKTLGSRPSVHREILAMLRDRGGPLPARWVYNLAHILVEEEEGLTRETPAANRAFVRRMVRRARMLFREYDAGVPAEARVQLGNWLRGVRRG